MENIVKERIQNRNLRHIKPGESIGRKKGTPNKVTVIQKQRIEMVLNGMNRTIESKIAKLKPKEFVDLWLQLQEYIRPKLARYELSSGPKEDPMTSITFNVVHSNDVIEEKIDTEEFVESEIVDVQIIDQDA